MRLCCPHKMHVLLPANEIAINPAYVDSSLDSVWKLKTDHHCDGYSLKYGTIQWLFRSMVHEYGYQIVLKKYGSCFFWCKVLDYVCCRVSVWLWLMVSPHRRSDSGGQVGTPCLFPTWRMHPMPQWRTCYRMVYHVVTLKSSYTGQCFPCTVPTGPPHTVLFFPQATAVGTHRHTSSFFCRHPCTSFCVCVCVCVVSRGCVAVSHFKVCRIQSLLFFCVCVCVCVRVYVQTWTC